MVPHDKVLLARFVFNLNLQQIYKANKDDVNLIFICLLDNKSLFLHYEN